MYTTLFPRTGFGINTYTNTIPPIKWYAFTRSPQFNLQYFSPKVDYKPWPGDYTDYRSKFAVKTIVRYVPKTVKEPEGRVENNYSINLTKIQDGTFSVALGMDLYNPSQDCKIVLSNPDRYGPAFIDTYCAPQKQRYSYYPATFYIKAPTKQAAKEYTGYSSYKNSKNCRGAKRSPGSNAKHHTISIPDQTQ